MSIPTSKQRWERRSQRPSSSATCTVPFPKQVSIKSIFVCGGRSPPRHVRPSSHTSLRHKRTTDNAIKRCARSATEPNTWVGIKEVFTILSHTTAEDKASVKNLTNTNVTLTEKVVEYANHLSTKESNIAALTNTIPKLQSEVKNLKAKIQSITTNTVSAAGNHTANMEYKTHPTWWSAP